MHKPAEKGGVEKKQRQFVQYAAFKVDPAWRRLPKSETEPGKKEFIAVCDEFAARMPLLKSYTLTGIRADTDFREGLAELAEWVASQTAVDRVDQARTELEKRGLVA